MLLRTVTLAALVLAASPAAAATKGPAMGHWAKPGDRAAQHLIDMERTWALLACDGGTDRVARNRAFLEGMIAPDFIGTSPEATLYTRTDMTSTAALSAEPEHECRMLDAKVRWFGADVAVVYGSETAMVKGADGKDALRKLVWTDTFLRRAGKWQAIAVQDMVAPVK